jgi:hypothetical protein
MNSSLNHLTPADTRKRVSVDPIGVISFAKTPENKAFQQARCFRKPMLYPLSYGGSH